MEQILLIIGVILIIISAFLFVFVIRKSKQVKQRDIELENQNKVIRELNLSLIGEQNYLKQTVSDLKKDVQAEQERLLNTQQNMLEVQEKQEASLQKGLENYGDVLEAQYKEKDKEYTSLIQTLEQAYDNLRESLNDDYQKAQEDLDKIRATRAAAIEATVREKEIKEKLSFYCLTLQTNELHDIGVLNAIKPQLNQPRILSMLIWQTYFRTPMTTLCNNILGTKTKIGIYKITNQLSGMCYIGQAVNVAERWKEHAKCGLGIDTPQGNKLYKAMMEDGLQNFSFELLEECTKELLDEKEKYYIGLYDSSKYGYNSTVGNNKKVTKG